MPALCAVRVQDQCPGVYARVTISPPLWPGPLSAYRGGSVPAVHQRFEVGSYQEELVTHLQNTWELARQNVKKAQQRQRKNYDRTAKPVPLCVGDRVYLHVPVMKKEKAHKFARPFKGPYRVLTEPTSEVPKGDTTRDGDRASYE